MSVAVARLVMVLVLMPGPMNRIRIDNYRKVYEMITDDSLRYLPLCL